MRRPIVAGNWKMNGDHQSIGVLLDGMVDGEMTPEVEWLVFPPFPYLSMVADRLNTAGVSVGAQTVSYRPQGAVTGAVSADMLLNCGCQAVLTGHSERRALFAESNEVVAQQFMVALKAGLMPILCVGETLEQREAGITLEIIKEQLAVVLALQDNASALRHSAIAYEPVWAIGTGKVASGEQAQEVHCAIRAQLAEFDPELSNGMRILYGGSVKPSNAAALFAMPDIDGALVGGASLNAEQFIAIGESWNK